MTLMFDPVEFIHRLERAGLGREAAEAIAQAIEERNARLATLADIEKVDLALRADIEKLDLALRADMAKLATKEELTTALYRQTIQLGGILGGMIALATAVIGVIVSAR